MEGSRVAEKIYNKLFSIIRASKVLSKLRLVTPCIFYASAKNTYFYSPEPSSCHCSDDHDKHHCNLRFSSINLTESHST